MYIHEERNFDSYVDVIFEQLSMSLFHVQICWKFFFFKLPFFMLIMPTITLQMHVLNSVDGSAMSDYNVKERNVVLLLLGRKEVMVGLVSSFNDTSWNRGWLIISFSYNNHSFCFSIETFQRIRVDLSS